MTYTRRADLYRWLPWAVVVILGLVLWFSHVSALREKLRLEEATLAAEAQTAVALQRADSLAALLPGLEASAAHWAGEALSALRALDSVRVGVAVATAAAARREREAVARIASSSADVDEALDNLRAAIPEVLLPLVDTLASKVDAERADRVSAAEALREQFVAQGTLLASTEAALAAETRRGDAQAVLAEGLKSALDAQVALTAAETARAGVWEARALAAENPSVLDRARGALPYVALGVVIGVGASN